VRPPHHHNAKNPTNKNFLTFAPKLSISQNTLGTLPEDGNVMRVVSSEDTIRPSTIFYRLLLN
jgi:hypothetical protein